MPNTGYRMIATAICAFCKTEFWLIDEPVFEPGSQPELFQGTKQIAFTCCDTPQSVSPKTVVYRVQRVIYSPGGEKGQPPAKPFPKPTTTPPKPDNPPRKPTE